MRTRWKVFGILLLIALAGLIAVYLDLAADPGYLLIAWRNTTFETSLVATVLALLLLALLLRGLVRLAGWLDPRRLLRRFRQGSGRSHSRTEEGLVSFVQGDWQATYQSLTLSFNDEDASLANYLAAAHAAHALGLGELWGACLDEAAKRYPGSLSTINGTRVDLLLKDAQLEPARALLTRLERSAASSRPLLMLRQAVYQQTGDWDRLEELLPELERQHLLDREAAEKLERQVFMGRLTKRVKQAETDPQAAEGAGEALLHAWDKAPADYHKDAELLLQFSDLLLRAGARREAARLIESALAGTWHDSLVRKYGEEDLKDSRSQQVHAEAWLQERPNNPELLLALGRIALRNQAWPQAREYFETSYQLQPSAAAAAELARLLPRLSENDAGQRYLEIYLRKADSGIPDLPLPGDQD